MSTVKYCEVIDKMCEHYSYDTDRNGEVVLTFCDHPDNKSKYEGNCTHELCPIIGPSSEDFS